MNILANPVTLVSEQRYDVYRNIHKGLRAALAETLIDVGRTDWNDADQAAEVTSRVSELLELIDDHLHHEDQFLHPALESIQSGSTRRLATEHQEHVRAIKRLRDHLQVLAGANGTTRPKLAHQLYHLLAHFTAESIEHMHYEEYDQNALLWSHYDDGELCALEGELVASVPGAKMARYLHWMLPAMNSAERASLLAGMRQGAPTEMFDSALEIARARLKPEEWHILRHALALPEHS